MARKAKAKGTNVDRIVYQIEETKSGETIQAFCPELLITAFGDTSEDARAALRTQGSEYLQDCEKIGALEEVLIDAGFYFEDDRWMSNEVEPAKDPNIRIFGKSPDSPRLDDFFSKLGGTT